MPDRSRATVACMQNRDGVTLSTLARLRTKVRMFWVCRLLVCLGLLLAAAPAPTQSATPKPRPLNLAPTVQQPPFRLYGSADGLPSSQVRALLQTRDGLLWIATFGGLASFDGRRFRQWRPPDDPRPLVSETLMEDADGNLWIAVEKRGLFVLDAGRRYWRQYSTSVGAPGQQLVSDDVWALQADPQGGFWFGGYRGGLQHMDRSGRVRALADAEPALLPIESVSALARDAGGGLWIGAVAGLWHWPRPGQTLPQRCTGVGDFAVLSLRADASGVWVVASDGQLRHFATASSAAACTQDAGWQAMQPEHNPQSVLVVDGRLAAIGLRNGVAWPLPGETTPAHDTPAPQLRWIPPRFGVPGGLPVAPVIALLGDREGGRWLGLFGGGLAWLPPPADQWTVIPHDPANPGGLVGRSIRDLAADADGRLWVASADAGLEWIDPALGAARRWPPDPALGGGRHSVQALAIVGDQLWAGTRRFLWRGQLRPDGVQFRERFDALSNVHLLRVRGDDLWAALRGDALYRLDARTGAVRQRFPPGVLAGDDVSQLALDPRGTLWVASDGGLQRFDDASGKLVFDQPVNQGDVAHLCFRDQQLWRYVDAQLEAWDADGRVRLGAYGRSAGIPAVDALLLHCAPSGLWLFSGAGLVHFDPERGRARLLAEAADGLPAIEQGGHAFAVPHAGRLWIGVEGGLLGVDPALPLKELPAVGFGLELTRTRVQRGDAWTPLPGRSLTLEPGDRNLRISARSIQFWRADATRYLFTLDGAAGRQRFERASPILELPRLPPGAYQLTVDADHPRLGQALMRHTLALTVRPPWWQTGWFRLLAGSAALALLAALFVRSRNQLKRRHARQLEVQRLDFAERIAEEKSRFLAQTSHEMKNLIGGASGVAGLIETQAAEAPVRYKAGKLVELCGDLLRLLDDLLENARLERGQIKLAHAPFDLQQTLDDTIVRQLERGRAKGLASTVEFALQANRRIGDPLRLKQIVSNLLSNAVKYTESGSVKLRIDDQQAGWLAIHVIDTGPGLAPGARQKLFQPFALGTERRDSTGLGLAICQQLARLAGGAIDVHSDAGGTRFTVQLPWPAEEAVPAPAAAAEAPRDWLLVGTPEHLAPWRTALAACGAGSASHDTLLGLCAALQTGQVRPQTCAGVVLVDADGSSAALAQALLSTELIGALPVHCVSADTVAADWLQQQPGAG